MRPDFIRTTAQTRIQEALNRQRNPNRHQHQHQHQPTPTPTAIPTPLIRSLTTSILATVHPTSDPRQTTTTPLIPASVYEITNPAWPRAYTFHLKTDPNDVDVVRKLESEMATLSYVRRCTGIPVPGVVAWDSSAKAKANANANVNTNTNSGIGIGIGIGYEWCLVEKVEGISVKEAWPRMNWDAKRKLIDDLAVVCAQLWSKTFPRIGSLAFKRRENGTETGGMRLARQVESRTPIEVGEMVAPVYYEGGRRPHTLADRGPFKSGHDWVESMILYEKSNTLLAAEMVRVYPRVPERAVFGFDEHFRRDAKDRVELCEGYLEALPWFIPPVNVDPESQGAFVLTHEGLNERNIFVDSQSFALSGIVSWDMARVLPMWAAGRYPKLIDHAFLGENADSPLLNRSDGSGGAGEWTNTAAQSSKKKDKETDFIERCKGEQLALRQVFDDGLRRFGMAVASDLPSLLKDEFCFGVQNLWCDWDVADGFFMGMKTFCDARQQL